MRVGTVILPEHRWWAAEPVWRMAEEYGFDHAWTYDHLGWDALVDKPWFDAIPTLTAAAMATTSLRLGTYVASPNFRHPAQFARALTSLDDISDGRIMAGIGAGSVGFDALVLGGEQLSRSARADRYAEFVYLLDRILSSDSTTWKGEYYSVVEARRAPGCVQVPRLPFLLAANGHRTMRTAARHGSGWVTNGPRGTEDLEAWWKTVSELSRAFDDALDAEGRVPDQVDRYLSVDAAPVYSMSSVDYFRDVVGRANELGFTDVITHWPRTDGPYAGSESIVEEIAAEVLPELA